VEWDPLGRYSRYDEMLGQGACKTVYKAFDDRGGREVAWNSIKVSRVVKTAEDRERLLEEVSLLKELKHKSIIKFYDSWVCERTGDVNFITEMFTSGTLRHYRKRHKHLDLGVLKSWGRQILRGLLYLHGHDPPIIHRDLKCDNIFVNGNQGELKIGDLGLATLLRNTNGASSVLGTPEFMAPELYEEDYDERVDIYSFGMCLLELTTMAYPYSECENAAQIYKKVTQGLPPAGLEKVKCQKLREFIKECIKPVDEGRPSARELLEHPFLAHKEEDPPALQKGGGGVLLLPGGDFARSPSEKKIKSRAAAAEEAGGRNDGSASPSSPAEGGGDPALGKPPPSLLPRSGSSQSLQNLQNPPASASASASASTSSGEEDLPRRRPAGEEPAPSWGGEKNSFQFKVRGKVLNPGGEDTHLLSLKLRILDREGICRTVEFPYNMEEDSAYSVANEMVEDLDLSPEDVDNIALKITREVEALARDNDDGAGAERGGLLDTPSGVEAAPAVAPSRTARSSGESRRGGESHSDGHSEGGASEGLEAELEREMEELLQTHRQEEQDLRRTHVAALERLRAAHGRRLEQSRADQLHAATVSECTSKSNGMKERISQMESLALDGLRNGKGKAAPATSGKLVLQGNGRAK